jgi:hypothetical protein
MRFPEGWAKRELGRETFGYLGISRSNSARDESPITLQDFKKVVALGF